MKKLLLILVVLYSLNLNAQVKEDSIHERLTKYLYENPDLAIKEANKLLADETDIDKKIKYHLYLAKAFTAKRNPDESFKTLMQAQELLKKSDDVISKIDVLIIIAIQYQQMELYSKSFETLEEADKLCEKLQEQNNEQKYNWLGKSNTIKGIIYKSQGNNEIALEKFFDAIHYFEKTSQSVPVLSNISIVYYNIGYCYFNLKDSKNAEKYFLKSLSDAEKSKAQSLQAFALKGLAENYAAQNNHKKALELLENAKEKAKNIGDLVLNEGIYKGLAENYLISGNFESYVVNDDAYRKSQFEREQSELKSINSLMNNVTENNNKLKKDISSKNTTVTVVSLLISIIISCVLLLLTLRKNKKNQELKKKIQALITQ